jgi:hypothetical protein
MTPFASPYSRDIEAAMQTFFGSLREKDRRRYAAVEATKLGPGGIPYLARLLGIDPNTIRQGLADLHNLPDLPPERVRRPGGGRKKKSTPSRNCGRTSMPSSRTIPQAAP